MTQYIITEEQLQEYEKTRFRLHDLTGEHYVTGFAVQIRSHPYNPHAERDKVLDEVFALLNKLYEQKYDPRPCNRTDNGGMYNDGELDLILEIQRDIEELRQESGKDGEPG